MFWTKILILNMSLFIMWGKIMNYLMITWKDDNQFLNLNKINFNKSIDDFGISYEDLIEVNKLINPILDEMRQMTFFRIFKVNFDSECNFWSQNKICSFSTCSICQCEEKEIPLPWKQDSIKDTVLKDVKTEFFNTLVNKYNYSSSEWLVETEIDNKNGIYVNLLNNSETWTGYQGQKIWEAIYRENCFTGGSFDNMCMEERLFYKIISGIHSNINLHLSKNYLKEDLSNSNQASNYESLYNEKFSELDYKINATLADDRVLKHPDRINNMFYLYSILLKSLKKGEKTIKNYLYETGNEQINQETKLKVKNFYDTLNSVKKIQKIITEVSSNEQLKKFLHYDRLDQIKMRFRNISDIIDCVGCQKCKLHGKLQIYGVATMLKILFENNLDIPLKRNELIAFINLCSKLARSMDHLLFLNNKSLEEEVKYNYVMIICVVIYIVLSIVINLHFYKKKYFERRWFNFDKKQKPKINIIESNTEARYKNSSVSENTYFISSKSEDNKSLSVKQKND